MYRIRFHGRGGQGIKTAGRILGTAFFLTGFEVQDAPRYGAERRGAPLSAYVRASRTAINERGIIRRPDLAVAADDTLLTIPEAGVLTGLTDGGVLLVSSVEAPEIWRGRLAFKGRILTLPPPGGASETLRARFSGAACAGAAARLVGAISEEALAGAIREELASLGEKVVAKNLEVALGAYARMADHAGCVTEGPTLAEDTGGRPAWVDLPFERADISAPVVYARATSRLVPTGLWRTVRPVLDRSRCKRCGWICSTLCPDGTIGMNGEGYPRIDYEHCKGCLICAASCPSHAIRTVPEREGAAETTEGARS